MSNVFRVSGKVCIVPDLPLLDGEGKWVGLSSCVDPCVGFCFVDVCGFIFHDSAEEFAMPCVNVVCGGFGVPIVVGGVERHLREDTFIYFKFELVFDVRV